MAQLLLLVVVGLPFALAAATAVAADRAAGRLVRASSYAALALAVIATLARVDVTVALPAGRALTMSSLAQFGVQLLALAMLGVGLSLSDGDEQDAARWLPLAWLSLGGLVLALLAASLSLAMLTFAASGLIWALGPAKVEGGRSVTGPGLRYAALLSLALPPLLAALRLAEMQSASAELEPLALALVVPGFGLILSVVPLHAWTVTLASGSPRTMVVGVLSIVQTAALLLLARTVSQYGWMVAGERQVLLAGGALSLIVGGWMALSSKAEDQDDWLAYAVIANTGFIVMGLGTQSEMAATGITLMLFARVLALVTIALAFRAADITARLARTAGTLTLAGTPGFAGFPAVWLILRALQLQTPSVVSLAVLTGSALLFATAVKRWWAGEPSADLAAMTITRTDWPLLLLVGLLLAVGIAPQLVTGAFSNVLSGAFLLHE